MIDRLTDPEHLDELSRRALVECWVAVTNAGGAVGFPFPPVSDADVAPAVDQLADALDPEHCVLFRAGPRDDVHGWVVLRRGASPLISHWATVERLQTAPAHRGNGVGRALMGSLESYARSVLGLEQLHLAVRGGTGLEGYYESHGWLEVGRWPAALRLSADEDRDEVLMYKSLLRGDPSAPPGEVL